MSILSITVLILLSIFFSNRDGQVICFFWEVVVVPCWGKIADWVLDGEWVGSCANAGLPAGEGYVNLWRLRLMGWNFRCSSYSLHSSPKFAILRCSRMNLSASASNFDRIHDICIAARDSGNALVKSFSLVKKNWW